jgi:hypothetical protein
LVMTSMFPHKFYQILSFDYSTRCCWLNILVDVSRSMCWTLLFSESICSCNIFWNIISDYLRKLFSVVFS